MYIYVYIYICVYTYVYGGGIYIDTNASRRTRLTATDDKVAVVVDQTDTAVVFESIFSVLQYVAVCCSVLILVCRRRCGDFSQSDCHSCRL